MTMATHNQPSTNEQRHPYYHYRSTNSSIVSEDNSISSRTTPFVTTAPMDPIIVQELATWLNSIQWLMQGMVEAIQAMFQSNISNDSLNRTSILLLVLERFQRPFHDVMVLSSSTKTRSTAAANMNTSNNNFAKNAWENFLSFGRNGRKHHFMENETAMTSPSSSAMTLPPPSENIGLLLLSLVLLVFVLLVTARAAAVRARPSSNGLSSSSSSSSSSSRSDTTTMNAILSSSFASSYTNQDVVIGMSLLFSIICLESFVPLILWGLTSFLLFRSICWETTLSLLVVTWLGGVISTFLLLGDGVSTSHHRFATH